MLQKVDKAREKRISNYLAKDEKLIYIYNTIGKKIERWKRR